MTMTFLLHTSFLLLVAMHLLLHSHDAPGLVTGPLRPCPVRIWACLGVPEAGASKTQAGRLSGGMKRKLSLGPGWNQSVAQRAE